MYKYPSAAVLPHVDSLLCEDVALDFACPESAGAGCRDMNESCTRLNAEINTTLGTSDVHIFYFRSFTEVLHDGCAVEYGIDGSVDL